jgi:surface polysaccharide O-acyltransferase-like enzyme
VGVVFIHSSADIRLVLGGSSADVPVINIVSEGIARVAVPLFFCISGYLFFVGFRFSTKGYIQKLKSRFWTLLVPFVCWNLAELSMYAIGQKLSLTKGFFTGGHWPPVAMFSFHDYLDAIIGWSRQPIAGQFWFVRDLMALVLLVPVINLILVRRVGRLFLYGTAALWYLAVWPLPWPSAPATFFFCFGAYLSLKEMDICSLDRYIGFSGLLFLIALASCAILPDNSIRQYVHRTMVVLGCVALWAVTRFVGDKVQSLLSCLGKSSFFVFAAHEPLQTILYKLAMKTGLPHTEATVLILYFAIPSCAILLLVIMHRSLRSACPTLVGILTGDIQRYRNSQPTSALAQ